VVFVAQRYDAHSIGAVRRTDAGALIVPGAVARTGIQVYREPGGREVREYRDAAEVFAADSLATLIAAPVTVKHPIAGRVDARSNRALSHGLVLGARGRETIGPHEFALADLVITSPEAITRIDARELTEISCGYQCETIDGPGVSPEGEQYDRRQTNIRYNHVALLPKGSARAGSEARLRLDSKGDQEEKNMAIRLGKETFDVATEPGCAALQSRIDVNEAAAILAVVETSKLAARADAAEAKLAANQSRLDAFEKDAGERARVALVTSVQPILGAEYTGAGRSDNEVRCDAIKAALPSIVLRSDSDTVYLSGILDAVVASKPAESYVSRTDAAPIVGKAATMKALESRLDSCFTANQEGK
jgi:uncharacterized protein